MALGIDTRSAGDALVVAVSGDVDIATAPALRAALAQALDGGRRVVVDLGDVPFLDSTGLGLLVAAYNRAAAGGGALVIARPQRIVRNALRLVQVDTVIPVHDSVEAALAAG